LLAFTNVWLISVPLPELAPVTLPVMVPNVQVKLLVVLAVKEIFVVSPLHKAAVAGVVIAGLG